jgi:hypothetical protein
MSFSEELLNRVNGLIAMAQSFSPFATEDYELTIQNVPYFHGFRSSALSVLTRAFGKDHHLTKDFERSVSEPRLSHMQAGLGILDSVRQEIQLGWLSTLRTLISAEVFSDFLEMASYFLREGYKDPAAVIIGSTLEEHLRTLCKNRGIAREQGSPPKPRRADGLNSDLAKATAYNLLDQKQVTAWLDLRNKAAHGHYAEYSQEQVQNMLDGVRNFLARIPQ